MKKIISVLIILTMLLSMCIVAMPASAAVGDLTLPVASWTKPWESAAAEWTAIGSYEELVNAFSGGTGTKKLYLTKDIEIPATRFANVSADFIFDGNGFAFKFTDGSAAVFRKLSDATIRNLKLTGTMVVDGSGRAGGPAFSPLGDGWENNANVTLENVVSNVNITVKNQDESIKNPSGVIANIGNGSTVTNVKYTGSIEFVWSSASDCATGAGGIAGWASGNITFKNCTTAGASITVPKTYKKISNDNNAASVGLIAGFVSGNATFENCTTDGVLNFNATPPDKANGNANPARVGGMAGRVDGEATFKSCTNRATVNVSDILEKAGLGTAGGFLGGAGKITMTDCTNNGTIIAQNSTVYIGGFVGWLTNNNTNTFTNCTNGSQATVVRSIPNSVAGTGGFIGMAEGEKSPNLTIKFINCVNDADVVSVAPSSGSTTNGGVMLGGFVGEARCVASFEFTNCINNGDIQVNSKDSVASYQGSGGFIGCQRVAGYGWTDTVKTITAKFTNCLNTGDIVSKLAAGGFVGRNLEMQYLDDSFGPYTITLTNCSNTGNISAPKAGGMYGVVNDVSNNGPSLAEFTFDKCSNGGDITGYNDAKGAALGGIVGYSNEGKLTFTGCVNGGYIGDGSNAAGILAQNITATVTIENSYVVGKFSTASGAVNPICNGDCDTDDNMFDSNSIDNFFNEAVDADRSVVEAKINALGIMASYNVKENKALIAQVKTLNSGDYDAALWQAVKSALADAEKIEKSAILTLQLGGGAKALDQKDVNQAYNALAAAVAALGVGEGDDEGEDEKPDALAQAIAAAEALKAEDYTADSWALMLTYLATAKQTAIIGDAAAKEDALEMLNSAVKALVKVQQAGTDDNNGEGNVGDTTPDEPTEPTEPDDTKPSDTTKPTSTTAPAEDKGGCGSVIGGAAVALTAIIALGAGVSVKKRED